MHLHTLYGTRTKKYPLSPELPCFPTSLWHRNCVSFKLSGSRSIGALSWASASLLTACLASCTASGRLPIRCCLPKSRATHCSQDLVVLGLILSNVAEVAPWFPRAGPCSEPRPPPPPPPPPPPRRTSSNSCFDLGSGSLLPWSHKPRQR